MQQASLLSLLITLDNGVKVVTLTTKVPKHRAQLKEESKEDMGSVFECGKYTSRHPIKQMQKEFTQHEKLNLKKKTPPVC